MIPSSRAFRLVGSVLVALAAFAAFAPAVRNGFVYDDPPSVSENAGLPELLKVRNYFTSDYFRYSAEFTYRPLVSASYALDYALWGIDPFAFHLMNLLYNSLAGVAFFLCCLSFRAPREMSLVAALLYATHPLRSEAAVSVGFREDLLCAVFYLAALALWPVPPLRSDERETRAGVRKTRGERRRELRQAAKSGAPETPVVLREGSFGAGRLAGSLLLYALALLSKEMALTFPLLALGKELRIRRLEGTATGFRWKPVLLRQGAAWAITFAAFALYLSFAAPNAPAAADESEGLLARLCMFAWISLRYVRLLVVPYPLCAEYVVGRSGPVLLWTVAGSAALWLLVGALCVRVRRRFPEALESFVAFFVMLAPVSNAVRIFNPMAERYLTIPATAFVWLCAALVGLVPARVARRSAVAALLVVYGVVSWLRVGDWRDAEHLWRDTVEKCPTNARAQSGLGVALFAQGRIPEALKHYEAAVRLKPDDAELLFNLGLAFYELGRTQEAIGQYQAALRLEPERVAVLLGYGNALSREGRLTEAVAEYEKALKTAPDDPAIHVALGLALVNLGRVAEGATHYEEALRIDPVRATAHNNLAIALARLGRLREAETHYVQAIRLNPENAAARESLEEVRRRLAQEK